MQGVYYRIFDKNIPSLTVMEGIVSSTDETICLGECELHHLKSKSAAIEYCDFSIQREELERFFIK